MEHFPHCPLQCLPQPPLNSPCGERLVLDSNTTVGEYWGDRSFNNIAINKFLQVINGGQDFLDFGGTWQWAAVVLMPEEYKLRVGGMSVTKLRQQLENYWGQGGILGAGVEEGYEDIWVHILYQPSRLVRLERAVFSHWVNRECTQWLSYFIAKNHTLGAVHAWFTAFLGVTRESLPNLAESLTNIARSQGPGSEAFMESIHRIKFRMSFDVCIEGHDEVVDGMPSLPSNTVITTNEKGMQVIHDSISNMFPRRIWDICANTVIPATWVCGPPCPLTGLQEVDNLGVKPISHAWVAVEDRGFILTEANQHMWPVPLLKGVLLEDVRGEMIRLGVRYAWLDVLCLRQRGQPTLATDLAIPVSMEVMKSIPVSTEGVIDSTPVNTKLVEDIPVGREVMEGVPLRTEVVESTTLSVEVMEGITPIAEAVEGVPLNMEEVVERREQRRLEEWKVDVPTIGAIYSNLDKDGLYGEGPIVIFMSGLGRPFLDKGWDSERHWLRRAWTLQESPVLSKCLIAGLPYKCYHSGPEQDWSSWPWSCKV